MAYIGRNLSSGNYLKLDDIGSQFNSVTRTFNLTAAGQPFYPGSDFSLQVSIAGIIQEPITSYTLDRNTITFASAPTTGSSFFCIVLGVALGIGVPGEGTVSGSKLTSPFNYNSGLKKMYIYVFDPHRRLMLFQLYSIQIKKFAYKNSLLLGDLTF